MQHIFKQDRYRAVTEERRKTAPNPWCKQCSLLIEELSALTRKLQKSHLNITSPGYRNTSSWQYHWSQEPDDVRSFSTDVLPPITSSKFNRDNRDLNEVIVKLKQELHVRNIENRQLRVMLSHKSRHKGHWEDQDMARSKSSNRDPIPPQKVASIYSDLYYTDWKLAYDSLREAGADQKAAIIALQNILTTCYQFCSKKSNKQLDNILCGVIFQEKNEKGNKPNMDDRNIQQMNDVLQDALLFRKHVSEKLMTRLQEDFLSEQLQQQSTTDKQDPVTQYIRKCVEVTWYMCLQDPPMVLDSSVVEFSSFDQNLHKHFDSKGKFYNYVVWPVLRFEQDGELSALGVAVATNTLPSRKKKQHLKNRSTKLIYEF